MFGVRVPKRAVSLLSGGLDSLLATKIILDQGIYIEGLNFIIGFGHGGQAAQKAANQLGIRLHLIDVVDEFKEILRNPKHGLGKNLNPCLDCKIFMVTKAITWCKLYGFDFIITGEVIGQRPKSQRRDTMAMVINEAGADDILLRPLSAKLLPPTLPEREGWVKRELLFNFHGRARKHQLELAKELALKEIPQPAGGCLLTDPNFCCRLQDLWLHRRGRNYDKDDLILLRLGRHLRLRPDLKVIIGRNEEENDILEQYCGQKYSGLLTISHGGPIALIDGAYNHDDIIFIARIIARFSSGREDKEVKIEVNNKNGKKEDVNIEPLAKDELQLRWYI